MAANLPIPLRCSAACTTPLLWDQRGQRWLHLVDGSVCDPQPFDRPVLVTRSTDLRTAINP
jgi:hypothetical protein